MSLQTIHAEESLSNDRWYYKMVLGVDNGKFFYANHISNNFSYLDNQKQHLVLSVAYGGAFTPVNGLFFSFQDYKIDCDNGCDVFISFDNAPYENFAFQNQKNNTKAISTSYSTFLYLIKQVLSAQKMNVKINHNYKEELFIFDLTNLDPKFKEYCLDVMQK